MKKSITRSLFSSFAIILLGFAQFIAAPSFESNSSRVNAATQTVATSLGREFFITFDANLVFHNDVLPELWLFISGEPGTSVDISYPSFDPSSNSWGSMESVTIDATGVISKNVTSNLLTTSAPSPPTDSWQFIDKSFINGVVLGNLEGTAARIASHAESKLFNSLLVTSSADVSVYGVNIQGVTSDAFIAIPTNSLGLSYRAVSYSHHYRSGTSASVRPSRLSIIATQDGTTNVTITPPAGVSGNFGAISTVSGSSRTVSLRKGEVYSVSGDMTSPGGTLNVAQLATRDLTGTLIVADKKIVAVSSNECSQVGDRGSCDHLVEYLQPVTSWGKEFLLPGSIAATPAHTPDTRVRDVYRVVAHEDATDIYLNGSGAPLVSLNSGEYHEFSASALGAVDLLSANKPVQVAKFLSGQGNTYFGTSNFGDPSMTVITPTLQFLREFKVATPAQYFNALNTLTVLYKTSDGANLQVTGKDTSGNAVTRGLSNLGTNGITGTVANSDYSFARFDIPRGTYSVSSSQGIGVYVEGFNSYNSYSYPGGFAVVNLVENPEGAIALEDEIEAQSNPPQNQGSGGGGSPTVTPTPTPEATQTLRARRTVTPSPTSNAQTPVPTATTEVEIVTPSPTPGTRSNPATIVRRASSEVPPFLQPNLIFLDPQVVVDMNLSEALSQNFRLIPVSEENKFITNLPSAVVADGELNESRIVVIEQTKAQVLSSDGGLLTLEARAGEKPVPVDSSGRIQMVRNNLVISEGRGLAPVSEFAIYLFSDPILLGVGITNEQGEFFVKFPVENDLPIGEHTLQVVGIAPGGVKRTVSLPVIVVENEEAALNQSIGNVVEVAENPVEAWISSISYLAIIFGFILILVFWALWWLIFKRRKSDEEEDQ